MRTDIRKNIVEMLLDLGESKETKTAVIRKIGMPGNTQIKVFISNGHYVSLKTIGEYTIVYILSQKYSFSIFDCFPLFSRPLDNFPVKL